MEPRSRLTPERGEEVRDVLERLCANPPLVNSPTASAMLRFIVDATIRGDAEGLKAYTIATRGLGRHENFDPQQDPIVRVTASRLRRALESHAQGPGRDDAVSIQLDRGSYVPRFVWRVDQTPLTPLIDQDAPPEPIEAAQSWLHRYAPGVLAAVAGILFVFGALQLAPRRVYQQPRTVDREIRPVIILGNIETVTPGPLADTLRNNLRAQIMARLRRFDDMFDIRDALAANASPSKAETAISYRVDGMFNLTQARMSLSTTATHLASRAMIHTSAQDAPRADGDDLDQLSDLAKSFVIPLAQPYGVIPAHAYLTAKQTSELSGPHACLLKVYRYWQVLDRASFDDAYDCAAKRNSADPGSASALTYLAFMQVEAIRGNYSLPGEDGLLPADLRARSLKTANRAVEAAPASAAAQQAMSAAWAINGVHGAALDSIREAVALNPDNPDLQSHLGVRLIQVGEFANGLDFLRQVIAMGGSQPAWRMFYAGIAAFLGRDADELHRYAQLSRKDDVMLSALIQMLDACMREDWDAVAEAKRKVSGFAPGGMDEINRLLEARLVNREIIEKVSAEITMMMSN
jgi:hypothetical protein